MYRLNRLLWKLQRKLAYRAYMRSREWQAVRAAVIKRARGMCEQEGCGAKGRDCHHAIYPADLFDTEPRHCELLRKKHHKVADRKRVRLNRQRKKARAK